MPDDRPSYDDVLIPTDGSQRAERAIDHGIDLAARFDATVHGLYVVDERRYGETPALSTAELAFEQFEEEGESIVEDVAERAREAGLEATTAVTRGRPHEEIVDYADSEGVDLVVMGRAGEGDAELPHLGSVTDRVLRTTEIPVLPV